MERITLPPQTIEPMHNLPLLAFSELGIGAVILLTFIGSFNIHRFETSTPASEYYFWRSPDRDLRHQFFRSLFLDSCAGPSDVRDDVRLMGRNGGEPWRVKL